MLNCCCCCCCLNTVADFRTNPCPPPLFWVCKKGSFTLRASCLQCFIQKSHFWSLVWTQSIAVSLQGLSSALFLTVHRDGGLSPICIPGPRSCWIEPRYILLCEDVSNSFRLQTPLRGSRGFGFVLESPSTRCRPHTASVNWMFTVRVFSKPQCQDL